jgi:hypothetical protein
MALRPNERKAIGFLLRHLAYGAAGGFSFGLGVLYFDLANIRTLAMSSDNPALAIGLLFFGLFITWGSAGMGIGVMTLAEDEN